ncbi:Uu.00g136990.m01.CDS01 [Anthostomella pinea]|uniref:Uu.00g136990.m01.CDS01 n=1 Tax=Anthostomella pinea TaxID=933095 RepID=A0AAI8YL33_9PEZI|nr:Uu.00g136990.m01.CDS01 [Anthostomella pinea]
MPARNNYPSRNNKPRPHQYYTQQQQQKQHQQHNFNLDPSTTRLSTLDNIPTAAAAAIAASQHYRASTHSQTHNPPTVGQIRAGV